LITSRGLKACRLSLGADHLNAESDVLLVDTLGQLGQLYKLGAAAFVGGSLVPVGGHNLLEPAAAGIPVLFGPHTDNFAEPAAILEHARAGRRVLDARELGLAVAELLRDADSRHRMSLNAEQVMARNRGALKRSVELMVAVLEGADAPPSTETS
jgi:3-deoxy-D-manno-octulosonic-acid transferase